MSCHPVEHEVDQLDAQVELELDATSVDELLEQGDYEPARGLYRGMHWRKERGVGCYHLRARAGRAWLHWDRWDPRRYPARHLVEVPELAAGVPLALGGLLAGGLAVVRVAPRVIALLR